VQNINELLEVVSGSERKNFISRLKDLFKSFGFTLNFPGHSIFRMGRTSKNTTMDSNSIRLFLDKAYDALKTSSSKVKDLLKNLSNTEQLVLFSPTIKLYVILRRGRKESLFYVPTIIVGKFNVNKEDMKFINVDNMAISETIKKVDGKYAVYPKRGGKRLGTHPTKEKAQKQLAAIEISKKMKESIDYGLNKVSEKKLFLNRVLEFIKNN
jgi:hypothetical protein